jgi:hypothetical protein
MADVKVDPYDKYSRALNTELMCYKCMGKAAGIVVVLGYMGMLNGVSTSDPITLVKPFLVVFGSTLLIDVALT